MMEFVFVHVCARARVLGDRRWEICLCSSVNLEVLENWPRSCSSSTSRGAGRSWRSTVSRCPPVALFVDVLLLEGPALHVIVQQT